MSGNRDKTSKDDEKSPDPQSRDFWYNFIQEDDPYYQGGLDVEKGNVDDQIKRGESAHRNTIGLMIVKTICSAFLILLGGGLIIFLIMVNTDTTYNVPLIINFMKEYAGFLKDGFLPIVLVALGYFFGSNNSR